MTHQPSNTAISELLDESIDLAGSGEQYSAPVLM